MPPSRKFSARPDTRPPEQQRGGSTPRESTRRVGPRQRGSELSSNQRIAEALEQPPPARDIVWGQRGQRFGIRSGHEPGQALVHLLTAGRHVDQHPPPIARIVRAVEQRILHQTIDQPSQRRRRHGNRLREGRHGNAALSRDDIQNSPLVEPVPSAFQGAGHQCRRPRRHRMQQQYRRRIAQPQRSGLGRHSHLAIPEWVPRSTQGFMRSLPLRACRPDNAITRMEAAGEAGGGFRSR